MNGLVKRFAVAFTYVALEVDLSGFSGEGLHND